MHGSKHMNDSERPSTVLLFPASIGSWINIWQTDFKEELIYNITLLTVDRGMEVDAFSYLETDSIHSYLIYRFQIELNL